MSDLSQERIVGSYLLVLELSHDVTMEVGRLGSILFQKGIYVYAGSAQGSLLPRLRRHFSKEKKIHWHIDYLLREGKPLFALIFEGAGMTECSLNRLVADIPGSLLMKGFGCSDCRCHTHLHRVDPRCLRRIEGFPGARRLSASDLQ